MALPSDALSTLSTHIDGISRIGPDLASARQGVLGTDDAGDDDSFTWLGFDDTTVTSIGLEGVAIGMQLFAKQMVTRLETQIALRGVLVSWSDAIDGALSATTNGERIARIASVLPGLGTTFRRANIDDLLAEARDTSREFQREIGRIDTAYSESLDGWREVESLADGATHVIPVIATAITAGQYVAHGLKSSNWSIKLMETSVQSLELDDGDARVDDAMTALSARYGAVASLPIMTHEQIAGAVDLISETGQAAAERLAGVFDLLDEIQEVMSSLDGLTGALSPLTKVLGAMTAPFEAIFDFLETPPKVFGVAIFPSISRSNIDAIVDFLGGLSDFIFGFLDPILDPILTPVRNAVSGVFDKLLPIRDFVTPMDSLDALMAELSGALGDLETLFDPLLELVDTLPSIPDLVEEIERPGEGETRATFFGGAGADKVLGRIADPGEGMGIDGAVLSGGDGRDHLTGTEASDLLIGGALNDKLFGLGGADVLMGLRDNDRLEGGAGGDVLIGNGGTDRLFGDSGDDELTGGAEDDLLFGGEGADDLAGGSGDDVLTGGAGDDEGFGGGGNDTLRGNDGADILMGQGGDDTLMGGTGDDLLGGGTGDDELTGGLGDDLLRGGAANDLLKGGAGNDRLVAGQGDDALIGGGDDDILFGGAGADRLSGGRGDDRLVGGAGADVFVFADRGGGADVILGFEHGTDRIEIAGTAFEDLSITQRNGHTIIDYGRAVDEIKIAQFAGALTAEDFL